MFIRRTSSLFVASIPKSSTSSSLSLSSFRFASSIPTPPTQPLSRPPSKHKAKKSKLPSTSSSTSSSILPPTDSISNKFPTLTSKSSIKPIRTSAGKAISLCTAEAYDTPSLLKGLQALGLLEGPGNFGAVNLLGEAIYIPRWSPGGVLEEEVGELFIFESGTIVSWGLSSAGIETFLRKVIRGSPNKSTSSTTSLGWVERGRYAESESEVLEYFIDSEGPEVKIIGDSIFLSSAPCPSISNLNSPPDRALLSRLALSAGMVRVTKLGVYEESFDEFASGFAGIPKLLESGSESPVKKTDIIKRVGKLHWFRQKLNLEDESLLDEPEFIWDDADLHSYYTSVCNTLMLDSRLTTLNQRVDYAFQLQSTLMDLLNTKTSHRLEWIIIILIAFEITIVLLREGFALSHGTEEVKKTSPEVVVV